MDYNEQTIQRRRVFDMLRSIANVHQGECMFWECKRMHMKSTVTSLPRKKCTTKTERKKIQCAES